MFDLDAFVADCQAAAGGSQAIPALQELLQRAVSRPRDVVRALGEPAGADLEIVHAGPEVTVCRAVWAPCMSIQPHNHNMPALIGIVGGEEDNLFWRRERGGLERASGRRLGQGDVAVLGHNVIHSVVNPRREYTCALHVYLGDYTRAARSEWDPQTFEERPFSIESSREIFAAAEAAWRSRRTEVTGSA